MLRKVLGCIFLLLLFISLDLLPYFTLSQSARDNWEMVSLNQPYYNFGLEINKSGIVNFGPLYAQYYTNSLGMKDRCIRQVPLVSNKFRILFIGDSFIEGVGYPYDSMFTGYLSGMLDTSQIEILDAGTRMYSPKLDYLRIEYLINQQKIKINEVYCALNSLDVMDELIFQNFVPDTITKNYGTLDKIFKFYAKYSEIYILYRKWASSVFITKNNLEKQNVFMYYIKTDNQFNEETQKQFINYRMMWSDPKLLNSTVSQKALSFAFCNLKKLNKLCKDNHIKLHLIIYPYGYVVSSLESPANYRNLNNSFISLFKAFANENKIDFINLFPLFTGNDEAQNIINFKKYFIQGDEHWNSVGHKRIADSLYTKITSQ